MLSGWKRTRRPEYILGWNMQRFNTIKVTRAASKRKGVGCLGGRRGWSRIPWETVQAGRLGQVNVSRITQSRTQHKRRDIAALDFLLNIHSHK